MKPALFSANSEGACPTCNGAGVICTDLAVMAGVAIPCELCEGKRFDAAVLEYHLGGRDISEVLAMSVAKAEEFLGAGEARIPAAHAVLRRLADVGPAPRGRRPAPGPARPARRVRQVGHRHRAPPGGDGPRRLDRRPRSGAGHDGGRIVFEGTPAELVADRSTLTGQHLAAYVGV